MGNDGKWDLARQVATVVGALFQVLARAIVPIGADRQRDTIAGHPRRLRVRDLGSDLPPLLGLRYLPGATRQWTEPLATARGLVLGRGVLPQRPVGGACSAAPARGAAGDTRGHLRVFSRRLRAPRAFGSGSVWNRANRWLVALPLGLLFGWITAANVVSFNDTLVELGLLGSGVGGALAGAFLLLVGAVLASVVILVSGAGPLQGLLAYAGAVLWALTGVVVNQYDASLLTTGAALLSGALVAIAIINTLRGRRPHIGASRSVRPRAAGGGG